MPGVFVPAEVLEAPWALVPEEVLGVPGVLVPEEEPGVLVPGDVLTMLRVLVPDQGSAVPVLGRDQMVMVETEVVAVLGKVVTGVVAATGMLN